MFDHAFYILIGAEIILYKDIKEEVLLTSIRFLTLPSNTVASFLSDLVSIAVLRRQTVGGERFLPLSNFLTT